MPDTSNQHKKQWGPWCQCHQSVKTRAAEALLTLNFMHMGQWLWRHLMLMIITEAMHVCNIFISQLHPPDSCMLSQLPIRTEAAVTFFQQHSLFPYPSGPEFCLVTLSSGRKRHYFRMLSGGHALAIHQNCNPIITVRVFPRQCPMGVTIKLHQSTSQTLPASHGSSKQKGKEMVKEHSEETPSSNRKVFRTSGPHNQIRFCYFEICEGNNSFACLIESSQAFEQQATYENLTYLNKEDFIHCQGLHC